MSPLPNPLTPSSDWVASRERVGTHFRQGAERWTRLTSEGPVSRIRQTVRAGRQEMRETLLSWLPADVAGLRILDAGCGTGTFSWELARRGAEVVGVDLAEELVDVARARMFEMADVPAPEFVAGDFLEVSDQGFDLVLCMDAFIHYPLDQSLEALRRLAHGTRMGIYFTVAPWTPLLGLMHGVGQLFPRGDRAPGIVPVRDGALRRGLAGPSGPADLTLGRTRVVHRGFYISRGVELTRTAPPVEEGP